MQKSDRLCVALLIGLCVWRSVSGFSSGSNIPASVCTTLKVNHFGSTQQTSSPPYTVTANTSSYQPGDTIRVTLSGSEQFRGFLVVAQTVEGGEPVGSFSVTDSVETTRLLCGAEVSALTQTRNSLKPSVTAIWTAPASDSLGNIVFRATFIKMLTVFWERVSSDTVTRLGGQTTSAPTTTTATTAPDVTTATTAPDVTTATTAPTTTTATTAPDTTTATTAPDVTTATTAPDVTTATTAPDVTTATTAPDTTTATTAPDATTATTAPDATTATTAPPPAATSAPFADSEISAGTCGRTDICIRSPPGCEPAGTAPCLFVLISFLNQSKVQALLQMRGETPGYIAVGTEPVQNTISTTAAVSVPYPNGTFALLLSQFNGTALTGTSQPETVRSVGSVSKGVLRSSSSINSTSILTNITSGTIRALTPRNMRFYIATGTFAEGRLGTPNVTRGVTAELPAGTGSTLSPSQGSTPSGAAGAGCEGLMLAASLFFRMLWSPV
ncbi:cell wall protein DAN4-like isoform X4 [Megalops cyprinoides]|nr:cell wall protein DAN4-like isoform X2 [Megalops cyprinoides]XP_036406669.1 cell wall protein DAN4-like isoform X3 [Megalops cyprinoides]XP_036406670.1 cell wall protein DAN4-like isoform X4 [Megalops cyprinoides]